MGKSSRSNRRREAKRSLPTITKRRYVPYTPVSKKKFSALRAGRYTFRPAPPKKQKRSIYDPRSRTFKNNQRNTPSVYSTKQLVQRLSGTIVLDTTKTERKSPVNTICEKRSVREQIMHAFKKTGKVGQKTPQWTKMSRKKCK